MFNVDSLLTFVVYSVFLVVLVWCSYAIYRLITNVEERKRFRTRIQREWYMGKKRMISKTEQSNLSQKFKQAGITGVKAIYYQTFRWCLLAILFSNYVLFPFVITLELNVFSLGMILLILIFSSPTLQFSLPNLILNQLIIRNHKRKQQELFTLFDMLQAELTSLPDGQEINVYNLVKGCTQYFEYIDTTLMKFLHHWKHNPYYAKDLLATDIGGESAETLSNVLFKIDETSNEQAIEVLEGTNKLFSTSYFEGGNRKKEKRFAFVDAFFFSINLLIMAWLLLMIISMFSNLLRTTDM